MYLFTNSSLIEGFVENTIAFSVKIRITTKPVTIVISRTMKRSYWDSWKAKWAPILLRHKPIETVHHESEKRDLKRVLGLFDVLSFGLGEIIGAGIFVVTGNVTNFSQNPTTNFFKFTKMIEQILGVAAHQKAGPAVIFSYLFSGIACFFSALCYSEFSTRAPISGSAYTYAYTVVGEFIAWIIGWDLSLEVSNFYFFLFLFCFFC